MGRDEGEGSLMLNYTTTIPVDKTLGEVSRLLARSGAASVSTHYGDDGTAVGLGFALKTAHGPRTFDLPVNVLGVQLAIAAAAKRGVGSKMNREKLHSVEHAERVAWRVAKDWLEAQLALIEAGMATLDQVMLPYLVARADGATLYEVYQEREQAAIEGGVV